MTKEQAHRKYAAAMKFRYGSPDSDLLAIFSDWKSLTRFAQDVGGHSYPGTYGDSPYDRAFSVAYMAQGGCISNSFVIDSDDYRLAMSYRERAGLSTTRDERGNIITP